ncbi:MAG TPA: CBS domain-containing protein [Cytophagaceae bacterium]|jgi:CBS domain-containing protein
MIAEELINQMLPPLKVTDSAKKAIAWMDEFRISQLPVVDNENYMGFISENTILESGDLNQEVSALPLESTEIYVNARTHFYDVIKLAMKNKLQLVAVVENKKFLGVISVNETATAIAQMFASQGPGGIIVLSLKDTDYSLSQISRLVESNDAKVLSAFVVNDELDPHYIKLTLKLNKSDLTRIIATFERYDYKIIANFQETELLTNDRERLDMLFKYLNI